jgi:hypothetical protein
MVVWLRSHPSGQRAQSAAPRLSLASRGCRNAYCGRWQMASKIECLRCGRLSASFVEGVCRSCYMREYHQRRSAAAATQCSRCGVASANFVRGVCRACYMRDYHQRRSAAAVEDRQMVPQTATLGDSERQRLCVECEAAGIYARDLCLNCYMRDRQRQRAPLCVECGEPGIYSRGLCRNCYVLDHRQRQRFCIECGAPGVYARSHCQSCYVRGLRRDHRMKFCVCGVCGVSFQSVRRDALYCSLSCRQKAHRAGKAQIFPKAAHGGERNGLRSAIETQDATAAARIEAQPHAVADRRQIDSTIEDAAKRSRTDAAPAAIDGQHKARHVLAGERQREASTVADLKAERATLGVNGRQIEGEAAPIRCVAKPIGADTDSEWTIRWLLALMVLCCDPPAIALTAAAPARNGPQSDVALLKITDDVLRVAD